MSIREKYMWYTGINKHGEMFKTPAVPEMTGPLGLCEFVGYKKRLLSGWDFGFEL